MEKQKAPFVSFLWKSCQEPILDRTIWSHYNGIHTKKVGIHMIYFDYAANTPVEETVLQSFCETNRDYIANPNSAHRLGREAKERMAKAIDSISTLLGVNSSEIIYTSGASEANNLAIKGIARAYRESGKHIISTGLEHSSVAGALTFLQSQGYEIDLLDITREGTIDVNHLRELLRKDTILVSVGYVDSELGVQQPIEEIAEIIKEYPNCYFHTDATQAVGKIPVQLEGVDLATFAPHKFFGLNGTGILIKKDHVVIEPLIHGGASTTLYRSGTPVLPMAVSTEVALQLAYEEMNDRYKYVEQLNKQLREFFEQKKEVTINSTQASLPYFLNVSVRGVKSSIMQKAMEEKDIFISTKSACSVPNTPSRAVFAVSHDRKTALSSVRISLSHQTTEEEIEALKVAFEECMRELL